MSLLKALLFTWAICLLMMNNVQAIDADGQFNFGSGFSFWDIESDIYEIEDVIMGMHYSLGGSANLDLTEVVDLTLGSISNFREETLN